MGCCLCSEYQQEKRRLEKIQERYPNSVIKVPRKGEFIPAFIKKVKDGDTADIVFFLSPTSKDRIQLALRFSGIDTPESKNTESKLEKRVGGLVGDFVRNKIQGRVLPVKIVKWGKYGGRVIGDVYTNTNAVQTISDFLLEQGYAHPYNGKKKIGWEEKELREMLKKLEEKR